ncbi:MAG: hypothetical protein RR838_11195 [Clostridium sp.]
MKKSIIVVSFILIAITTGILHEKRVVKFSPDKIKTIEIRRNNNIYIIKNSTYIEELCSALKVNKNEFVNTNVYGDCEPTVIIFNVNNNEERIYTSESEEHVYRLVSGSIGVKTKNKDFKNILDKITK